MNREEERSGQKTPRSQKQLRAPQQGAALKKQKKKKVSSTAKDARVESPSKESVDISEINVVHSDTEKEVKSEKEKRPANVALRAPPESHQRKLSDASNASEDLSKDSGCVSGKLSSAGSNSEMSDCPSEGHKHDSQSDIELSWIDGKAYVSPDSSVVGNGDGHLCAMATQEDNDAPNSNSGNNFPGFPKSPVVLSASGTYMDMTGETTTMEESTEDLVREVEDLRSENEYLKDEVEELRCEILEMRDLFHEDEAYQLQELRVQLEQANKMCRILHYRLRKAERRSIRVAQTGQVDGELVRSLEHDIKVAKSVSLRLHNELEMVQKKSSQLEWENEGLRERTQELEVAKQVLQAELDKAREGTLKRKSVRSPTGKAEKRLSQQIEDDSKDLKCQLHFAKEELALMCKKLTKLVSESESMRQELTKYHSAFGDVDVAHSTEGKPNSAHAREAEVKVHLRLVEEEATLLSRRIVELEVENRGLRAEMSDLRERVGGGGGEEEEEEQQQRGAPPENEGREGRERVSKAGYAAYEPVGEGKGTEVVTGVLDCSLQRAVNQAQAEETPRLTQATREGPVGGERSPSDSQDKAADRKEDRGVHGMTGKDYEALLALRDHSCILSSSLRILTATTSKNGHCSPPSSLYVSPTEVADPRAQLKAQDPATQRPLNEAVEVLQAMLSPFIGRLERFLTAGGELGGSSLQKDGSSLDLHVMSFVSGGCEGAQKTVDSQSNSESAEHLHAEEMKELVKQVRQGTGQSCRELKTRLTLQILWVLHHWCQMKGPGRERKEVRDKTLSVLQELIQEIGAEHQEDGVEFDTDVKATQSKLAESAVNSAADDGRYSDKSDRTYNCKGKRHRLHFSPYGSNQKNWCYLSQEAAQLDREDPTKTWDHPIMPLSFPDLDLDQTSTERSHTAPERTALRVYYSPPSARRVQLARLPSGPAADQDSITTASPWCTPPSSFSPLCLGMSANMSDDMKEMTAGLRQVGHSSSLERKRGRFGDGWPVDVASSGTQTQMLPQMVSVGLQTDGPHTGLSVRSSPTRILHSSALSARTHHLSSSLERVAGRVERPKATSTSPRLYRRHSASCSSFPSTVALNSSGSSSSTSSSSSSSSGASRERALWNLGQQGRSGTTWARPASTRASAGHNHGALGGDVGSSGRSAKPPGKPAGTNRYGMVTEFLRRVSGRADKPVPAAGQKAKSGPRGVERIPSRPPPASLQRNDSVTRIVNQRFMKQREEAGRVQKEEKGSSQSPVVRGNISRDQSSSTLTAEDGSYGCSSSSTLTFCFARPSRPAQRQASHQSKAHQRHGFIQVVGGSGDSTC